MFDIHLYTFSKKPNSTKQPTGTGRELSIHSWDSFDILSPVLWLDFGVGAAGQPYIYNYAYIPDLTRYYYVKTWECSGGLWKAYLEVDALASWKTQIGAQSLYVARASNEYDGDIKDGMYPVKTNVQYAYDTEENPWMDALESQNGGNWVVGVIGKSSTSYYVMRYMTLRYFLSQLLSDAFYAQFISALDLAAYPEAKVAIDPLQYIESCRWYPFEWDSTFLTPVDTISVGLGTIDMSELTTEYQPLTFDSQGTQDYIPMTFTLAKHPQSATRGRYLNAAPFSAYHLAMPPFGIINLDPAIVAVSDRIRTNIVVDARTGAGELFVMAEKGTAPDNDISLIARVSAPIGINYPLSYQQIVGYGAGRIISEGIGAIGSLLSGDIGGAIAGGMGMAENAVMGHVPRMSTIPGTGNTAAFNGLPGVLYDFAMIADEDNADRGRPLCKVRTISSLGGYVQCPDPDVSIACTQGEKDTIVSALAGGLHYE